MYKRAIIINLFFGVIYCISALPLRESYFSIESWYRNGEIGGEIKIQLVLAKTCNDTFEITIRKEMTPFSQIIYFTTTARYKNGRYEFISLDNWGNSVYGHFIRGNEEVILFLDVNYFSDIGSNVSRLYGEISILTRGTISF